MNFASHVMVTINLTNNQIGGPLDVIGGLLRPDAVVGATTTIASHGNTYSPQEPSDVEAWKIVGGSSGHRANRYANAGPTTSSFLWARLPHSPTAITRSTPNLAPSSSNTAAN
jgi:hypothetical protein